MCEPASRRAVGLHADGIDHRRRAPPVGHPADRFRQILVVLEIEDLNTVRARLRQTLRHEIDADHLPGAAMLSDARTHLPDRSEAEHHDLASGRDVRVLDRLPRRG